MIEINYAHSAYIYRICPDNPRKIQRRKNVHRGRWTDYAYRDTPQEAKASLLRIEQTLRDTVLPATEQQP